MPGSYANYDEDFFARMTVAFGRGGPVTPGWFSLEPCGMLMWIAAAVMGAGITAAAVIAMTDNNDSGRERFREFNDSSETYQIPDFGDFNFNNLPSE